MNKRYQTAIFTIIFILVLFSLSFAQQPENITITTYYPSPYGSYNELQLYPHTDAVTTCSSTTEGTMYYDNSPNERILKVCSYNVITSVYEYKAVGESYWAASTVDTNDIYNTNTGDVGIGTTDPATTLHVSNNSTTADDLEAARFESPNATASGESQYITVGTRTSNEGAYMAYVAADDRVAFGRHGASAVLSLKGGNVGIGTTGPGAKLGLTSAASGTPGSNQALQFSNTNNFNPLFGFRIMNDSYTNLTLDYKNASGNWNATPIMTWDRSSGNVGIGIINPGVGTGVTSPAVVLDVAGGIRATVGKYVYVVSNQYCSNPGFLTRLESCTTRDYTTDYSTTYYYECNGAQSGATTPRPCPTDKVGMLLLP